VAGGKVAVRKLESRGGVPQTAKARAILQYAHDSAEALLKAFETVRRARHAGRGTSTDEEQDLLRAMLVMAAAGLDSSLKQLIRDCLPDLARMQDSVAGELEKYVVRQLRGDQYDAEVAATPSFLAKLLVAESLRDALLERYILSLTGGSLQSPQELLKVCNALAVDRVSVGIDARNLGPIFTARNRIIHELDINFDTGIRNRYSRSRQSMVDYSNALLEIGEEIIKAVEAGLAAD
jgi:hypothetical protein